MSLFRAMSMAKGRGGGCKNKINKKVNSNQSIV